MARKKLPVEPFETEISRLNTDGTGAGQHGDRQLRIHGALVGERVSARYLFGRSFKGQAETLEVLSSSPERAEPRCPNFGTCGACTLQHLIPEAQLGFKQNRLMSLLDEAGVQPGSALPPLAVNQWNYRRKARLSVRDVRAKGRVLVGFRERDGRFVADMRECHVLYTPVAEKLDDLSDLVGSLDGRARIPQIEVACGDEDCALVFRHLDPLSEEDLDRLRQFSGDTGFQVYLQPKGPTTVHALAPESPPPLSYQLPEESLRFEFRPLDFFQVNGELNRAMIAQALELLELGPEHRVLDLFCGLGNFTLPIACHAGDVLGLEGSADLVERARVNAVANGIDNVRFAEADLYAESLRNAWPAGRFDRVLLDPPRSGAEQVLQRVAETGAERIVYVSCNPETLARDAAILVNEHGYRLHSAGIMDMFPQSTHIETMALFERR